MTKRRWLQLDVFADRPGAGNPLGVVVDAQGMAPATMQAIAAWTNLSETIFLLPPTVDGADYRVRIFTPRQELPFAGHPSVGAAWAIHQANENAANGGRLMQECAAGLLPVRIDGAGLAHVRAPRATRLETDAGSLLDRATAGFAPGQLAPALWNNGPCWWLVQLADDQAVRRAVPDLPAIAALTRATGAVGLAVFGSATDPGHDLVVRAFCPADNIPEDPVTGSANACIAAALHAADQWPNAGERAEGRRYVASQGREVGRDGRVQVEVDGDAEVWIGGQVQRVIEGEFHW
ncbi:PhzF family phenazine biosynthesis protein [Luteimonas vadosa]|uniref:PhzF family phenazine biosynthesis protein n=1 Tax=Luteimonas vadosa TaxID=1165507 RepID=A0ABP9DYD5_9GAMM